MVQEGKIPLPDPGPKTHQTHKYQNWIDVRYDKCTEISLQPHKLNEQKKQIGNILNTNSTDDDLRLQTIQNNKALRLVLSKSRDRLTSYYYSAKCIQEQTDVPTI